MLVVPTIALHTVSMKIFKYLDSKSWIYNKWNILDSTLEIYICFLHLFRDSEIQKLTVSLSFC